MPDRVPAAAADRADFTGLTLPSATNFCCAYVTDTLICLEWDTPIPMDVLQPCGFRIYSTEGSANLPLVNTFHDTGRVPGATYRYILVTVYRSEVTGMTHDSASSATLEVRTNKGPSRTIATIQRQISEGDLQHMVEDEEGRENAVFADIASYAGSRPRAVSCAEVDLQALSSHFRESMVHTIRERTGRDGLTTYKDCFVGSEAVTWLRTWLCDNLFGDAERDAVLLGNKLMDTGLFVHVERDHILKNESFLYHFTAHGSSNSLCQLNSAPVSADESGSDYDEWSTIISQSTSHDELPSMGDLRTFGKVESRSMEIHDESECLPIGAAGLHASDTWSRLSPDLNFTSFKVCLDDCDSLSGTPHGDRTSPSLVNAEQDDDDSADIRHLDSIPTTVSDRPLCCT